MSNNLDLDQVASAQNQKEVTINDQSGQLDAALTETLALTVDDGNALTLTEAQLRRANLITFTDDAPAPTAEITLTFPAVKRGVIHLLNSTGQIINASISGQSESAVSIPVDSFVAVHSDGSNVRPSGGGSGGGATNISLAAFAAGTTTDAEVLVQYVADRAFSLPVGLAGSQAYSIVATVAAASYVVSKNGTSQGTIDFALGAQTATFTFASAVSFAIGDRLTISAPATADTAQANISFTLAGSLT